MRRRAKLCIKLVSSLGMVTSSYSSLTKSTWSSLLNFLPYNRMYLKDKDVLWGLKKKKDHFIQTILCLSLILTVMMVSCMIWNRLVVIISFRTDSVIVLIGVVMLDHNINNVHLKMIPSRCVFNCSMLKYEHKSNMWYPSKSLKQI